MMGLQKRIANGEADPISDREREQLEELRQDFIRRFGYDPDTGKKSDTYRLCRVFWSDGVWTPDRSGYCALCGNDEEDHG